MVLHWVDPEPVRDWRRRFAWWPVLAYDTYTGRRAWAWMTEVTEFNDGRVTFSTFAM